MLQLYDDHPACLSQEEGTARARRPEQEERERYGLLQEEQEMAESEHHEKLSTKRQQSHLKKNLRWEWSWFGGGFTNPRLGLPALAYATVRRIP